MDPLKLLSRSTKLSKGRQHKQQTVTPSSGQLAQPQLFASGANEKSTGQTLSRKRKRGDDGIAGGPEEDGDAIDFFQNGSGRVNISSMHRTQSIEKIPSHDAFAIEKQSDEVADDAHMALDEIKRILKQHKLKVTWLNPPKPSKKERRKTKSGKKETSKARPLLFPTPLQSFDDLRSRFDLSRRLVANIDDQGFTVPTEAQLSALPLLLDTPAAYLPDPEQSSEDSAGSGIDLLTVAPTGSGKTLAYMLPLLHNIQLRKGRTADQSRHTSAVVLVPTKELASQIVNEGRKLAKGIGINITQMRKGMILSEVNGTTVGQEEAEKSGSVVKADIIVSTPGVLQSSMEVHQGVDSVSRVDTLILDEADVLLDPLFREQSLSIWNSLYNPDLRTSMWSATMGSNIEELALSTIQDRRSRLASASNIKTAEAPIVRLIVGLKDSAVPNVEHKLTYAATEQGKLMGLRQLLHPAASSVDSGPPLRPPFLVFTQTIERAIALHAELLYDIPAEAGGISRIAVLHSDLPDTARDSIMTRFRKGEIWILITTDLLSRGVDFRGVNGVVNYDIPTSSAAYVHRVGRTGRAGREGGVAVTLYSKEDIPYLKHIANVVAMAQKTNGGQDGMQQWLLDAIPSLSKNEKQNLKKRGIQSRTTQGRQRDPKAARKARISTKAGFVRKAENKRKGAIQGSRRRLEIEQDEYGGDETNFGGFD